MGLDGWPSRLTAKGCGGVKQAIGVMVGILLCVGAWAESKTEAELRARLAATEAGLAAAKQERAVLMASLAKLTVASTTAAKGRMTASDEATVNAASAQATAEVNAAIARQAAAVAAAVAAVQGDSAARGNTALMIVQAFGFLAVLAGILAGFLKAAQDRRWAKEDSKAALGEAATHREVVLTKLGQVGDKADLAYKEANTVNLKLEKIGVEMKDGKPLDPKG